LVPGTMPIWPDTYSVLPALMACARESAGVHWLGCCVAVRWLAGCLLAAVHTPVTAVVPHCCRRCHPVATPSAGAAARDNTTVHSRQHYA
jgi:hypothetical protein